MLPKHSFKNGELASVALISQIYLTGHVAIAVFAPMVGAAVRINMG
jgi:hypothetical protein